MCYSFVKILLPYLTLPYLTLYPYLMAKKYAGHPETAKRSKGNLKLYQHETSKLFIT